MPMSSKVWEFMVKEPPTVGPADSVRRAFNLLKAIRRDSPGVQSLIVADPVNNHLKGVITLRRIMEGLRKAIGRAPASAEAAYWERTDLLPRLRQEMELVKVKDVMSKNIYQVKPYDSIGKAMDIMLDKKVRGLPVVESQRVIGVIRMNDIFNDLYDYILSDK